MWPIDESSCLFHSFQFNCIDLLVHLLTLLHRHLYLLYHEMADSRQLLIGVQRSCSAASRPSALPDDTSAVDPTTALSPRRGSLLSGPSPTSMPPPIGQLNGLLLGWPRDAASRDPAQSTQLGRSPSDRFSVARRIASRTGASSTGRLVKRRRGRRVSRSPAGLGTVAPDASVCPPHPASRCWGPTTGPSALLRPPGGPVDQTSTLGSAFDMAEAALRCLAHLTAGHPAARRAARRLLGRSSRLRLLCAVPACCLALVTECSSPAPLCSCTRGQSSADQHPPRDSARLLPDSPGTPGICLLPLGHEHRKCYCNIYQQSRGTTSSKYK
ncbi:unnamed protein product [Protopolystoma xenopodis]|uniref:Uncharacterized protein n=1 Tax=Protopolystoma xenopodis TaxID=117903 RepID=A0A3S4ZTV7_9PLAT|nr:unnamed protein product [Protopolystoma xenopodis]